MSLSEKIIKDHKIQKGIDELIKQCDNRFDAYLALRLASIQIEIGTITFPEINYPFECKDSTTFAGFCEYCHHEGNNFSATPSGQFIRCPKCKKRHPIRKFQVHFKEDKDVL
jgi:hypothetical protein